jgi:hypothetical protein
VTDWSLSDALFLNGHPSWSQRDLDEADQDVVDYLSAISRETALEAQRQNRQAEREQAAAAHRSRLGGPRG